MKAIVGARKKGIRVCRMVDVTVVLPLPRSVTGRRGGVAAVVKWQVSLVVVLEARLCDGGTLGVPPLFGRVDWLLAYFGACSAVKRCLIWG